MINYSMFGDKLVDGEADDACCDGGLMVQDCLHQRSVSGGEYVG